MANSKRFYLQKHITIIMIIFVIFNPSLVYSENPSDSSQEYKVLMLMGSGVGQNYFDVRNVLESWNCSISIVGTSSNILSCHRKDPQVISTDYVISEVNENILSNFDCLIIPSGGHHAVLTGNIAALNLISTAYHAGLIIGGICTGLIVLAEANGIVSEARVANFGMSDQAMREAGAIIEYRRVVLDKRIVTGGPGGGLDYGGNTVAPTLEFCEELNQAVGTNIRTLNIGVIIGSSVAGGICAVGILGFLVKKKLSRV